MESGSHNTSSLNSNSTLRPRDTLLPLSTGFPILEESLHLRHASNSRRRTYMEDVGSDVYSQNHLYYQNTNNPHILAQHRFNDLHDFSQSNTKKHSLNSVIRTRRRKAGITEEERVCVVCSEPASGYNFDRLTCESCKAFFRRNALKPRDKIKACSRGGGCIIEGNQRKHCPSCRLEKCLAVGMKRELILPPEKLEQRAKPRRRKHHSPHGSNSSPQHFLTGPSSVSSNNTSGYPTYLSSPINTSSHQLGQTHPHSSYLSVSNASVHIVSPMDFAICAVSSRSGDLPLRSGTFSPNFDDNLPKLSSIDKPNQLFLPHLNHSDNGAIKLLPTQPIQFYKRQPRLGLVRCRRATSRTFCQHRRCRNFVRKLRRRRMLGLPGGRLRGVSPHLTVEPPDPRLLHCLQDCIRRIREPFTPEEQLETGVAVTLEQEYNRMDACIRRIIRVVKLLPYFGDVGKPAQLNLLRTNIYGLIVLYSSFFFERNIRKLRYPVLQSDGQLTTVTVSMLDEVVTPSSNANDQEESTSDSDQKICPPSFIRPSSRYRSNQFNYAVGLREEFELYKANTLAAFDHLDQLIGSDDILRMCILAIKLFTDNSLSDDMREPVYSARQAYSVFLWNYVLWQTGSKKSHTAAKLYARLFIAFIDLRTLEIRMTEFAKLLSLDGLSPLMREVCSQRTSVGSACV